jgi:hypothetical protein
MGFVNFYNFYPKKRNGIESLTESCVIGVKKIDKDERGSNSEQLMIVVKSHLTYLSHYFLYKATVEFQVAFIMQTSSPLRKFTNNIT